MLNIAGEIQNSLCNGPGMRYVLFVQGCPHHCEGCQNEHTWSNKDNKLMTVNEVFERIIKETPLIRGVTFSGGEPFMQSKELYELGKKIKNAGLHLMVYSGFTYEQIKNMDESSNNLLKITDILVDGKFEINNIKNAPEYAGSKNQKVLFLSNGEII